MFDLIQQSLMSRWVRGKKHRLSEVSGSVLRGRKRRWVIDVHQPLILISEVQRSGGTLLSQLFDGHPQCFSHPEEIYWGRPQKWNWPNIDISKLSTREIFNTLHEPWIDAYGGAGFYRKKPGYTTEYPFVFDLTLQRTIFRDQCKKFSIQTQRDVLNAYMTSFFNGWVDYQNLYSPDKKYITGFTPRVLVESSAEQFFADYPDGYIISLVRNPEDWYVSARKHAYFSTWADNVEALMARWTESTVATIRARKQYPGKVLVIQFESIITDTAEIMKQICDHVGISFSNKLLRPTFNGLDIRSNSSVKSVYGIDRSVVGRSFSESTVTDESTKAKIESITSTLWRDAQSIFGIE